MSTSFENATTKSVDVNGTKFVFREMGKPGGVPWWLLHHLTAVLEDWDPRVVDGLAAKHHVIVFDNRGSAIRGSTPKTVEEMARDAVTFIGALGFSKVDLLGFSLGGFVVQVIAQQHPVWYAKLFSRAPARRAAKASRMSVPFYRTPLARRAPATGIRSIFFSLPRRATARRRPTTSCSA